MTTEPINVEEGLALSPDELIAVKAIGEDQELSPRAVVRQALRHYQLLHERMKNGETFHFSGDAQRAAEFAGVSYTVSGKIYEDAVKGRQDFRQAYRASQQQLAEAVEVLTKILDGFVPRPLGKRWRADGQPSKFDECIHAVSMGQDCGRCTDDMISDFLTKHRREG